MRRRSINPGAGGIPAPFVSTTNQRENPTMLHMTRSIGAVPLGSLTLLVVVGMAVGSVDRVVAAQEIGGVVAPPACEATLDPEEVNSGDSPVTLTAVFSEEVGEVRDASIDEESGVELLSLKGSGPNEVTVTLVTRNGSQGAWELTFHGAGGDCTARLVVTSGARVTSVARSGSH